MKIFYLYIFMAKYPKTGKVKTVLNANGALNAATVNGVQDVKTVLLVLNAQEL